MTSSSSAKLLLTLCVLAVAAVQVHAAFERTCLSMDIDWRWHLGDFKDWTPIAAPGYDDSTWEETNVPHDFVVLGTFSSSADKGHGYLPANISWYRHNFTLTSDQQTNAVWWIEFDGVYRDSSVWLNGHLLGNYKSGYLSFRYNISASLLVPAGQQNVLVVRADATYFEGWWYEGGGIYRHVNLCGAEPLYVAPWGVYVNPQVTGAISNLQADALIAINTTVWNVDSSSHSFSLLSTVVDSTGKSVGSVQTDGLVLGAAQALATYQEIKLTAASLWAIDSPTLYTLQSKLVLSAARASVGHVARNNKHHHRSSRHAAAATVSALSGDVLSTTFGVRKLEFDVNNGFFLNGEFTKVKGMCNHQDFGGTGVAMPDSIIEYRLRTLKDMGVNALRASHNAQTPTMLDWADKLGLLVWNEERLYNGIDNNTTPELNSLVLRDRNHPSVFMWSLCNEYSCGDAKTFQPLMDLVKQLDSNSGRPVTAAMNHGWFDSGSMAPILDVVGFNYNIGEWPTYHTDYPKQPMTGSETSSAITSRGIYVDSIANQLSAYDTHQPGWGNFAWQAWQAEDENDYMEGGFVWTGFDYKGEPTPYSYPSVNSYFGALDMVGFPKDNYYYYRAWWKLDEPLVHILPHWSWPDSQVGKALDVWVYSSAAYVELIVNGKSLGVKAMVVDEHVEWSVTYEAGSIQAIAYTSDNQTWATETLETAGSAAAIQLSIEKFSPTSLTGDGENTALITVSVVDSQGRVVPTADNLVNFTVTGTGSLLGVGNGDATCLDPDKANYRKAFNGLARALLQADLMQPGESDSYVELTATSSGLTSATIQVPVVAPKSLRLA